MGNNNTHEIDSQIENLNLPLAAFELSFERQTNHWLVTI